MMLVMRSFYNGRTKLTIAAEMKDCLEYWVPSADLLAKLDETDLQRRHPLSLESAFICQCEHSRMCHIWLNEN
jgi:hypothetical protein